MTLQEFANQFIVFINQRGGDFRNWYVGIASDPDKRLFVEHNVPRNSPNWIYDNASTEANARSVEKFLIETYHTQGDTGGGDATTTWVYAYRVTSQTRQ